VPRDSYPSPARRPLIDAVRPLHRSVEFGAARPRGLSVVRGDAFDKRMGHTPWSQLAQSFATPVGSLFTALQPAAQVKTDRGRVRRPGYAKGEGDGGANGWAWRRADRDGRVAESEAVLGARVEEPPSMCYACLKTPSRNVRRDSSLAAVAGEGEGSAGGGGDVQEPADLPACAN